MKLHDDHEVLVSRSKARFVRIQNSSKSVEQILGVLVHQASVFAAAVNLSRKIDGMMSGVETGSSRFQILEVEFQSFS